MLKKLFPVNAFALLLLLLPGWLCADPGIVPDPLYPGFPRTAESKAYQKIKMRKVSDLVILHYLIDRFADSKVTIVYEGYRLPAVAAANLSRWFLVRQYRKETPEEWILRWCNKTVMSGQFIWVELPDKSHVLSREVLLAELAALRASLKLDGLL